MILRVRVAAAKVLAWVWIGVVLGTGFVAAPARFMTPGLERADALNVGRTTFIMQNHIELVLAIALIALLFWRRSGLWPWIAAAVVVGVIGLQGQWLIPELAARTDMIVAGDTPPPSPLHMIYLAVEFAKLAALAAIGVSPASASRRDPSAASR